MIVCCLNEIKYFLKRFVKQIIKKGKIKQIIKKGKSSKLLKRKIKI